MPNNAEYGDQQTTTVESTESAGDKFKVRREVPIFDYPPSHYEHEIHNYSSGKSKKDKKREKKGKKVKSNKPLYRTPQANLRFAQGLINLMQNIPKLIDLNKPATTDDTYLKFTMETAMFTAVKKAGADYKMDTFNKFVKDFRKIIKHEPSIPKDLSMWEFLTLAKSIAHLMIGDIFGQGIDMQECVANLMKIGWLSPKLSWPHLTLPGLIFREVLWLGSFVNMRFMKIIPVYEQLAEIKLMDCKEFTFGMGTK